MRITPAKTGLSYCSENADLFTNSDGIRTASSSSTIAGTVRIVDSLKRFPLYLFSVMYVDLVVGSITIVSFIPRLYTM